MRWISLFLAVLAHAAPVFDARLIFPLEQWHNHSSSVVELPGGDLLVCWYHGSGERKADDVKIEASRLKKNTFNWGPRFLLADTPSFPDANPVMFVDRTKKLWLFWPLIIANEWHTSALQMRVTSTYPEAGKPVQWQRGEQLVFQPRNFQPRVQSAIDSFSAQLAGRWQAWAGLMKERAEISIFREWVGCRAHIRFSCAMDV